MDKWIKLANYLMILVCMVYGGVKHDVFYIAMAIFFYLVIKE